MLTMSGGDKVKHQVKWIEENLGISRKALRGFEKLGLMPQNENRKYRVYSDADVERIWKIRVLQGMGFTLKEIADMKRSKNFDFDKALAEKIKQLEKEKEEVDRHLGYAQTIKLTGKYPSYHGIIGSVKFDEFQEKSLEDWNVHNDPTAKQCQKIVDMLLNQSEDELNDTDLGKMLIVFENLYKQSLNWEAYLNEHILLNAIVSKVSLGADDPEVQLLVKMMYENLIVIYPDQKIMTFNQFARIRSSFYIQGDCARVYEQYYGKEGCKFIADAIAIFGGYKNYSELKIRRNVCKISGIK